MGRYALGSWWPNNFGTINACYSNMPFPAIFNPDASTPTSLSHPRQLLTMIDLLLCTVFWSWTPQTAKMFLEVKGSPSSEQPPCEAKALEVQDLGWAAHPELTKKLTEVNLHHRTPTSEGIISASYHLISWQFAFYVNMSFAWNVKIEPCWKHFFSSVLLSLSRDSGFTRISVI